MTGLRTPITHSKLAFLALFSVIAACWPVRAAADERRAVLEHFARRAAHRAWPGRSPAVPTRWQPVAPRTPGAPILTPTPDNPHTLPAVRTRPRPIPSSPAIRWARSPTAYGVTLELISGQNQIADANLLEVGQVLTIPRPRLQEPGPDFKIIPDSELVYGPSALFDVEDFVQKQGGYLATYYEEVDDETLSGAQIVQRIAQDYSVNPRLLLAVLQHQSGWLTDAQLKRATQLPDRLG